MRLLFVANACLDLVDNRAGQRWCDALQRQVTNHFAPRWDRSTIIHYIGDSQTEKPGATDGLVKIVRHSSEDGTLGAHWLEGARPVAEVGVQTCLDEGVKPERCLSHEGLEALADEYATLAFQVGSLMLAFEVCDRVEDSDDDYEIDGVPLENFSLPAAFIDGSDGPWDFRGRCASNGILAGGYQLFFDLKTGGWTQLTGPLARRSKRAAALSSRRAARISRSGHDHRTLALVAA